MRTFGLCLGHNGMKVGGHVIDHEAVIALRAEFAPRVLNRDDVKAGLVESGVEVVCEADDLRGVELDLCGVG